MTHFLVYLICLLCLTTAITTANGNYGYGQQYQSVTCDRNTYERAQNSLRLDIQQQQQRVGVGGQSGRFDSSSYGTGGLTNGYQGTQNDINNQLNDNQCRLVRQNFNDLVHNTPLCESVGTFTFQTISNLIEQSRRFLQQYCERNQGHQYIQCFKAYELNQCQNQFSYTRQRVSQQHQQSSLNTAYVNVPGGGQQNSYNTQLQQPVTFELCQAFETFRNCVYTTINRACYHTELEHAPAYLVDHARNLAWSCVPNFIPTNVVIGSGGIGVGGAQNPPYGPRRTDIVGYPSAGNMNPSYSVYPSVPPFSSRSLPTHSQPGNQLQASDRLGGVIWQATPVGINECIKIVQPFENSCTELMIQRRRDAVHGRSSNDVQRRICCAIFYYRDCLSRIVLERCVESSKTVVDILMSDRNRELSTNCRDYTRDQCNSAQWLFGSLTTVQSTIYMLTSVIIGSYFVLLNSV